MECVVIVALKVCLFACVCLPVCCFVFDVGFGHCGLVMFTACLACLYIVVSLPIWVFATVLISLWWSACV